MKSMKDASKWWWIGGNHNTSNSSPWLNSTLSELNAKTREMLRVIDEVDDGADSFVKRAKIYYEEKPKLIAMVEDLYRSHRSLAQRYDHVNRNSSLTSCRHNSSTCGEFRSELCEETESEVDDGEENQIVKFETMKEELERLREENRFYKEMMMRERREVTSLFTNLVRFAFMFFLRPFQLGFILFFFFAFLFTIFLEFLLEVGCFTRAVPNLKLGLQP